jgi:hypothetical protein
MTAKYRVIPEAGSSASGILTKKEWLFAIICQKALAICAK